MNKLFIFIFILFEGGSLSAQKKEIDLYAIEHWPSITNYAISNNGKFIWYEIDSTKGERLLVISDATGKFKQNFLGCSDPKFSPDSKYLFLKSKDGILQLSLLSNKKELIKDANGLMVYGNPDNPIVAYNCNDQLIILNLKENSQKKIGKAEQWFLNSLGTTLVIKKESGLEWVDVLSMKRKMIYNKEGVEDILLHDSGDRLIFSVTEGNETFIYKYLTGADSASILISQRGHGIPDSISLSPFGLAFNKSGDLVFLKYKIGKKLPVRDNDIVTSHLDLWSYDDRYLQSEQLYHIRNNEGIYSSDHLYQGVISFDDSRALFLENTDTLVYQNMGNKYALLKSNNNDGEVYWNEREWPTFKLVSFKDRGIVDFLPSNRNVFDIKLSSFEKFVVWADTALMQYFTYEISTGTITSLFKGNQFKDNTDTRLPACVEVDGWLANDAAIIVHDKYDIWKIDPKGLQQPVCITNGYGRRNKISFSLINDSDELSGKTSTDGLIVASFSEMTKRNGFFKVNASSDTDPTLLTEGNYIYYYPGLFADAPPRRPIKAKYNDVYLFQRQSDSESSNLVITRDFSKLRVLSDVHPERDYRWFDAELVHWVTRYGEPRMGILYKPKELDTLRKYPIIFNYYEIRSTELFKFNKPGLSVVNINVPYYLNLGYLVFIPDIPRKRGHTFENALESIESGAAFITDKYKWIDKTRMGLQGQSYGGTVTNFVATHSQMFVAAQSTSGRTDHISGYGGLGFGNRSLQGVTEIFQNNLGYTPWERPDTYIKNSSIFGVGNASTPLLIAHGAGDLAVNISQSIELFTALRRAKKKVWLLQYSGGHIMDPNSEEGKDFAIRQQQFFDYYLRGASAPIWMIEGIPAKYKGIKSGLQLDTMDRKP